MAELEIKRGSYSVISSVVTPASLVTSSTIYFMAKRYKTDADADAIISKSSSDGIAVTNAGTGTIAITIEAADTRTLNNKRQILFYEIEIEKAGKPYAVDEGKIIILPELIQRAL
jgi:hypothetical protein